MNWFKWDSGSIADCYLVIEILKDAQIQYFWPEPDKGTEIIFRKHGVNLPEGIEQRKGWEEHCSILVPMPMLDASPHEWRADFPEDFKLAFKGLQRPQKRQQ